MAASDLVVKQINVGDQLVNSLFTTLTVAKIVDSDEKSITIKVTKNEGEIPRQLPPLRKTLTGEIKLPGFKKHIPYKPQT